MAIDQQWIHVALEEYKSLRSESLAAQTNQKTTLKWGATMLGTVVAISANADAQVRYVFLAILIPLAVSAIFLLFSIEFARVVRISQYMITVEAKINSMFAQIPPLGWEAWLNTSKGRLPRLPFYPVIPVIFSTITTFSTLAALYFRQEGPFLMALNTLLACIVGSFSITMIAYASMRLSAVGREYKKIVKQWDLEVCNNITRQRLFGPIQKTSLDNRETKIRRHS